MSALRNMRSVSSVFRRTGAALPRAAEVVSAAALPFPAHAVRTRRVTGETADRSVVPAGLPRRSGFPLGCGPRMSRPRSSRVGCLSRLGCHILPVRPLRGRGRINNSTQRQRERDTKGRCKSSYIAFQGVSLPFGASPNVAPHTHSNDADRRPCQIMPPGHEVAHYGSVMFDHKSWRSGSRRRSH
jgi:hypothetical protein